jgi:thymidylate kinase
MQVELSTRFWNQCELQPLSEYLRQLFQAFADSSVEMCVLRNYRTLPQSIVGNDIDLLIAPEHLNKALSIVASIPGTKIVGLGRRSYVLNLFIQGVAYGEAAEALQLDLMFALSWKGITYLDCREVLKRRKHRLQRNVQIPVPSPEDEAIISFMSSYLIGGFVKERYQQKVIETFQRSTEFVGKTLSRPFGPGLAEKVVESVVRDDRPGLANLLKPLRWELAKRAFLRAPVHTFTQLIRHYACELPARYSRRYLTTVALLGVDGSGKSSVIAGLEARLHHVAKSVEFRHLRPRLLFGGKGPQGVPVTEPQAKRPRSRLVSIGKIFAWLAEEWLSQFVGRASVTLRISDRFYHDLLIDNCRYRYGGPRWIARLIGSLMPQPDLWLLLDAPLDVVRARKQEVSEEETARQLEAYRSFVKTTKNYVIVDAAQPIDVVVADAHAAIIDTLARRCRSELRNYP